MIRTDDLTRSRTHLGRPYARSRPLILAFALLLLTPPAAARPKQESRAAADAQTLEPGRAVEQQLAGGQAHEYAFAASTGQYLRLTAEQSGVDLVLEVRRADGRGIFEVEGEGRPAVEVDKANGTRGREELSLVADDAGEYLVRVRAREEKAAAGRYVLSLADARPATPQDAERAAADRAFAAAKHLMSLRPRPPDALAKAVRSYKESLERWGAAGDTWGEATALLNLGNAHFRSDDRKEALGYYERAAVRYESAGDPEGRALALLYQGMCQLELGDSEAALALYGRAVASFAELDDRKYLAFAYSETGRAYYLRGDGPEALKHHRLAMKLREAVDDRKGVGFSFALFGRVYFYLMGEEQQAVSQYERALDIFLKLKEHALAGQTRGDIGRVLFSNGEIDKALAEYEEALKLQAGDRAGQAETLGYIGMAYTATGRHQEALEKFYAPALAIQREAGDRVGAARTLHNMGVAHFSGGDDEQALGKFKDALGAWKGLLFRTAEAETRYWIARTEARRGNLAEARKQLEGDGREEGALRVAESLRTKIVNQHLRISYFASVQKYYELYIDVLMRMHAERPAEGLQRAALGVSERARSRSLLDTLVEARADIHSGVEPGLLRQESELQQQLSDLSQRHLLGGRQTPEQGAQTEKRLAALLAEYQRVQELIRERSPRYAALTQPATADVGDIQTTLLDADTTLLEYALGDERSYLWVVTRDSVEAYVLPKRADIEAAVGGLRGLLTERNRAVAGESNEAARARVERAEAETPAAAKALSEMLKLPDAIARARGKRLLVVGDAELQYAPFALLPVPAGDGQEGAGVAAVVPDKGGSVPLLARRELVMLPSASVLGELRRERPSAKKHDPAKLVAAVVDPVYSQDDERVESSRHRLARVKRNPRQGDAGSPPLHADGHASADILAAVRDVPVGDSTGRVERLRFVRREADYILKAVPPKAAVEVVDFAASKKTVFDGKTLPPYAVVHFGTHGLLNDEHPELSGLLLSLFDEEGRPQDGFLQLHEIYNLNLPAELVVLSACETGVGKKVRGEGLMALTRGFMYAGAKRVVASLWQVNDASTSRLMKSFYEKLLRDKSSPAAALRAAQLEMLRHPAYGSPYYWASFVVQGEWQGWMTAAAPAAGDTGARPPARRKRRAR